MESCYSSNVLLFWLTWNPNNQLSGSMVWITKTYLIFDPAGTKQRGTDRRLQVQVTSLLISNWDKQFLLKLKLYFRLWLGLGDTLMLFIYHSTVTCTQTCTCELWLVTCILFCACLHYMELDSLMFLAGYAWPVLSIHCLSNQMWVSISITLTCAADITGILILGPISWGRNNGFWELAIHNLSVLISGVPYIPVECQGNILIKHSSKELNVVIVIVVFFLSC